MIVQCDSWLTTSVSTIPTVPITYNGPSIPVLFSLLTCFRHTFSPKPVGDVRACSVLKFHCELSISVDNVYTLVSLAEGSTPPPSPSLTQLDATFPSTHPMLRIIRQPILDVINRPRPFTVRATFISHFSHQAMINFLFILIVGEHIFISLKYLFYLVLKSREVLMTLHLMLRSLHPFLCRISSYFALH